MTQNPTVGTLSYNTPGKPHAVSSTSDGRSFGYDAYGNQEWRDGPDGRQELDYTAFDLPVELREGPDSAPTRVTRFEYDASGTRTVREADDGDTTTYVSGLYRQEAHASTSAPDRIAMVALPYGRTLHVDLDESTPAGRYQYEQVATVEPSQAPADAPAGRPRSIMMSQYPYPRANRAMRVLLIFVLACSCGCGVSALSTASSQWYEVRSPRFRLWTEGDPEEARALAVDLERFHTVMLETTSAEEPEAAPPLKILLAKDESTLRAWTGTELAGLFVPTIRGNLAFVTSQLGNQPQDGEVTSRHVLFHEYTHYMMASGGGRAPSWYNEGFAEYMAATELNPDGTYTLGCPPRYRTRWTQYVEWLPIGRVMDAQSVTELSKRGRRGFGHTARSSVDAYGQSWYLVHFFLQDSSRHAQLRRYLQAWGAGAASEQAAKDSMGLDYAQLDLELREYASRKTFACVALRSKRRFVQPDVQVRPISKAEAHYQVGELLLSLSNDLDAARAALLNAVSLQPDYVEAIGALARVQLGKAERAAPDAADAELKQAEAYLARARVLAPETPERFAIAGHVSFVKAVRAQASGDRATARAELEEARTAYRKAIRGDDSLAEAYVALGETYLFSDNGSEEGQVVLEAAAYLVPLAVRVALMLGKLHVQRHDPKSARPALEHVVLWGRDQQRREASELLRALPEAH